MARPAPLDWLAAQVRILQKRLDLLEAERRRCKSPYEFQWNANARPFRPEVTEPPGELGMMEPLGELEMGKEENQQQFAKNPGVAEQVETEGKPAEGAELGRQAAPRSAPARLAPAVVTCPAGHVLTAFPGQPPDYIDFGDDCTYGCDICGGRDLRYRPNGVYHCTECFADGGRYFDACPACAQSASATEGKGPPGLRDSTGPARPIQAHPEAVDWEAFYGGLGGSYHLRLEDPGGAEHEEESEEEVEEAGLEEESESEPEDEEEVGFEDESEEEEEESEEEESEYEDDLEFAAEQTAAEIRAAFLANARGDRQWHMFNRVLKELDEMGMFYRDPEAEEHMRRKGLKWLTAWRMFEWTKNQLELHGGSIGTAA